MNEAAAILRSVTTLRELLKAFAKTIGDTYAAERTLILLPERGFFCQQYSEQSTADSETLVNLAGDDPIIRHLEAQPQPLVLDELHRVRATPELERVMERMHQLRVAVAMPIFSREHLAGVMLLGPRLIRPDLWK